MIPGHSRLAPHGLPLDNPIHDNVRAQRSVPGAEFLRARTTIGKLYQRE